MKKFFKIFCSLIVFLNLFSCQNKEKSFNIILISIDTLRADHLSCYGYSRNTSPNIDRIARKGVLFKNTIATSSFTPPSMASIFTSKNVSSHGIKHGVLKKGMVYNQEVISSSFTTLAEALKEEGYATFGFHTNPHLAKEFGFAQGFDFFKQFTFANARRLNKEVLKFKEEYKKKGKYFLWVHYFDPHWPYFKREPWGSSYSSYHPKEIKVLNFDMWPEKFSSKTNLKEDKDLLSYLIARYDSEINFVDKYVGELIDSLKKDGDALVIITSDHGEEFLEHGRFTHGFQLYEESIRVPLIINFPSKIPEGIKVENEASIIDIMPTILEILKIKSNPGLEGKSLIPLISKNLSAVPMAQAGKKSNRILYSELYRFGNNLVSARFKNWKYIYNIKENRQELYDLGADIGEKSNIILKNEKVAKDLQMKVIGLISSSKKLKGQEKPVGKKALDALKSLGYIN